MSYLLRNRERIADPGALLPGARSTVALARDYGGPPTTLSGGGRIARYAVGRDYHRSLGKAAVRIRDELERGKDVYLNNGLSNMSPTDHNGYDERSAFLIKVEGGRFRLVK